MEKLNNDFEKADPWRRAILMERAYPDKREKMLQDALATYSGERKRALILGDACLVQSNILLEKERFEHVVDVDSSPSLMDDDIVSITDTRLERILSTFDAYEPPTDAFNVVYGKSIAFNPKNTIGEVLQRLSESLAQDGLFYAIWGMEEDSFRRGIAYTDDELTVLYDKAGLQILEKRITDKSVSSLLERPGRKHAMEILAKKK